MPVRKSTLLLRVLLRILTCCGSTVLPLTVLVTLSSGSQRSFALGPASACCIGSTCLVTDERDCETQGGYFLSLVGLCTANICATGACCLEADGLGVPQCRDDDGLGGAMDESFCASLGGAYVGGSNCVDGAPCPFHQVPDGYEVIDVTPISLQGFEIFNAQINDCGQITFPVRFRAFDNSTSEVLLYDNGSIVQLTEDDALDTFPDVNDDGALVWSRRLPDRPSTEEPDPVIWRAGQLWTLGQGFGARINGSQHVTWSWGFQNCAATSDIYCYNARSVQLLFSDGLSNQGPEINNLDDIAWTRYKFPCAGPCCPSWTSDIMLYSQGSASVLPSAASQPQGVSIDNLGRVAWSGFGVEVWDQGVTTPLFWGSIPGLSDRGDIAFSLFGPMSYQLWLYREGNLSRLTTQEEIDNRIDGINAEMNAAGEIAWAWHPNGLLSPSGIKMLRRIRTGDVDIDDDVDMQDFVYFPGCYTGPAATDGLCQCRFLDIDHDRDVDIDDFNLFLSNYVGPLEDCNGNGTLDLEEMAVGTSADCNRNGIPDECDFSSGTSVDANGDGKPDDCVCPGLKAPWLEIFPVDLARFFTIIPRNAGKQTAIRVTLTSLHHPDPPYTIGPTTDFSTFEGQVRWVGPPTQYIESEAVPDLFWAAALQCIPHYRDWSTLDLLHVTGAEVLPSSRYDVDVVGEFCNTGVSTNFSPSVMVLTSRWGDVASPYNPPSETTQPDAVDLAALVDKFRSQPGAPIKAQALLAGNVPDPTLDIGFDHISACVDAFRGAGYPYPGPASCP